MLASVQSFVQQRYHALLMGIIGLGFVLLLLELVGYQHVEGLQLIGTGATVVGAVAAFLGISARGNLRRALAVVFLVLAATGLLGAWEHNEQRLGGEREGQRAGQFEGQPGRGGENGERGEGFRPGEQKIPPPPLAPLSLSGFCVLGAIAMFGRKDPE